MGKKEKEQLSCDELSRKMEEVKSILRKWHCDQNPSSRNDINTLYEIMGIRIL